MTNLSRSVALAMGFVGLMLAAPVQAGNVPTSGQTASPKGFHAFCAAHPTQCRTSGKHLRMMSMNSARWTELRRVNGAVNRGVRYASAGPMDKWSIAASGGSGDCKSYALTKRKQLMQMGWPSSVLLITAVKTRSGEGHAVLTVRTDEGDYVLDNRSSSIRRTSSTEYRFFSMQSATNPRSWVAVPRNGNLKTAAVSVQKRHRLVKTYTSRQSAYGYNMVR